MPLNPLETLTLVEEVLWVLDRETWFAGYDFRFDEFFSCEGIEIRPPQLTAVARVGALEDYDDRYQVLLSEGIRLINSPSEHLFASWLPCWYPLLEELTPK